MKDALVTRGVNVRPRKPRFESCPPRGLVVSGTHWVPPHRERKSHARRRLVARDGAIALGTALDGARARMYAAQDAVRALKDAGASRRSDEFKAAAAESRAARAAWLELDGGLETRELVIAAASDANKIKAV